MPRLKRSGGRGMTNQASYSCGHPFTKGVPIYLCTNDNLPIIMDGEKLLLLTMLICASVVSVTVIDSVLNPSEPSPILNDVDYPDDDNSDDANSISNNSTNKLTLYLNFTDMGINSYNPTWILNDSIPEQDLAVYLDCWETYNNTFSSYMANFTPDFNNKSYVFVYWEKKGTSGYDVNITKIHYDNGSLFVYVEEEIPDEDDAVFTSVTRPVCLVEITKNDVDNLSITQIYYVAT